MATFAATYVFDTPRAVRLGNRLFGLISGKCTIGTYSQTPIAQAALLGMFRTGTGLIRVVAGMSEAGYGVTWNDSAQCWTAYGSGASSGAALTQVTEGSTSVGTFDFIAIGQLGL